MDVKSTITLISGRRVTTSQLLATGDMIQIADHCLRSHAVKGRNQEVEVYALEREPEVPVSLDCVEWNIHPAR